VDASTPRYRLDVVWTGQVRPVSAGLATYLEAYRIVVPIGQEIQVSTDTKSYWLPIQDVLVPPLKEEVAPNSRVTLYVTFLGCDPDYVAFTVNEFTAG
jgi:hypothetical protein